MVALLVSDGHCVRSPDGGARMIDRRAHIIPRVFQMRRSRRRWFLASLAVFLVVHSVRAQTQRKPARIGFISAGGSAASALKNLQPFRDGMRERGYVLDDHYVLDIRVSRGDTRRFPALAEELIALGPDVLLAFEASALAMAAKTKTIPIVLLSSRDPVAAGLVKSLARPGTNVTGMSGQWGELLAKQVELLHELVPRATRIALLSDPSWTGRESNERIAQRAATTLGMEITFVYVQDAGELQLAFAQLERHRIDGLIVLGVGPLASTLLDSLADGIRRLHLPTIGAPSAGGLVSYNQDAVNSIRETADFVDRILRGAKPHELPVRQSNRYLLDVNKKLAREMNAVIPQSILLRADSVID